MVSRKDDFSFSDVANREFRKLITTKLIEFNRAKSSKLNQWYKPENDSPTSVEVYSVTKPQLVVGGLIGYVHWGWLEIDIVWVDEFYRGKGIGKHLVDYAEHKALDTGAKRAKLNTFDFQAKEFYEKLGYVLYGRLEDYPEGHTLYYLRKDL